VLVDLVPLSVVFCESGLLIFDRYGTSSDGGERLTFGDFFFFFFWIGLVWWQLVLAIYGSSLPWQLDLDNRYQDWATRYADFVFLKADTDKPGVSVSLQSSVFKTPSSHNSSIADFFHLLHLL
jgi:hypothetical protein